MPDRDALGSDKDTLLNSRQTRARMANVSDMTIWRWMDDEKLKFPRPQKIRGRHAAYAEAACNDR